MTSLLRISDLYWPATAEDLRAVNPQTDFPKDLSRAGDLTPFGFVLPTPTTPPIPGDNQAVVEVRPEEIDGEWRQQWRLVDLPPPPPAPDWDGLAADMQTANGFKEYFMEMDSLNPFSTIAQVSRFDDWKETGNWQPFLAALLTGLAALPPAAAALLAEEFLTAATARKMDPAFLAALEDAMTRP